VTIASSSPVRTPSSPAYWNGGSGTGVEFIMAKNSWWDVHTVSCGSSSPGQAASKSAQGLSFRDVSGVGQCVVQRPEHAGRRQPDLQVGANNHIRTCTCSGICAPNTRRRVQQPAAW
jgi:hypothetical protein